MKMKRSQLIAIVKEELARHLVREAEKVDAGEEEEPKAKKPRPEDKQDASGDKKSGKPQGKEASKAPAPKKGPELPPDEEPADEKPEVPDESDPADEEMPDEEDAPSGGIADEVVGKTVQSLTIEPKSKILPGAKEVVISFNESPDALRLLLTPTGQVKFFYRGKVSDIP